MSNGILPIIQKLNVMCASHTIFDDCSNGYVISDLHDLKRLDFHNSVFEVLRDRLVGKIENISKSSDDDATKKLEAILEKSFPLNKIDSLLPVSMCLLKHLPKVQFAFLKAFY